MKYITANRSVRAFTDFFLTFTILSSNTEMFISAVVVADSASSIIRPRSYFSSCSTSLSVTQYHIPSTGRYRLSDHQSTSIFRCRTENIATETFSLYRVFISNPTGLASSGNPLWNGIFMGIKVFKANGVTMIFIYFIDFK